MRPPFRLFSLGLLVLAASLAFLPDAKAQFDPIARFSAERESQLEQAGYRRAADYEVSGAWVRSLSAAGGRAALAMGGGSSAAPARQPSPIPAIIPPSGAVPSADRAEFMGGRPGATGPAGPKGDKGDKGEDGKTPSEDELARIIAAVVVQLKAELKGDKGDAGPAGPAGPAGAPGRDGRDASIDDVAIDDLIGRLPPITVRTINDAGQVVDEVKVRLGGDLNLHHHFNGRAQ